MKRTAVVLILLILTFSIYAEMSMSFGVKGGISLNHMWGDDWDAAVIAAGGDNTFRLGFSVGGFASIYFMENLALQPEVYLSLIGGGYDYTTGGNEVENTQRLWVLEIPILLKLSMPAGKFRGSVFAGGNIMIKLFDYIVKTDDQESPPVDDNLFQRPYFGLVAGLEMDIPITESLFFITDLRYCLMVSDIYDDAVTTVTEFKSNSFKIMVGIGTGLK